MTHTMLPQARTVIENGRGIRPDGSKVCAIALLISWVMGADCYGCHTDSIAVHLLSSLAQQSMHGESLESCAQSGSVVKGRLHTPKVSSKAATFEYHSDGRIFNQ